MQKFHFVEPWKKREIGIVKEIHFLWKSQLLINEISVTDFQIKEIESKQKREKMSML